MGVQAKPKYNRGNGDLIFKHLRLDALQIVAQQQSKKRLETQFKAIFFPLLYLIAWLSAITLGKTNWIYYTCFFVMGLLLVCIYLNVIHDAVHHTIFKSQKLNKAFVYIFDLIGANSFIWKNRHVRFHHNYPNVNGWDTDIEQSDIARVFPNGDYSDYHKYQHIYLPLIYPLFLFNWLVLRDFKDFFQKKKTVRKLIKIPFIEYVKLFFFKALFFFNTIILPKIMLDISWAQAIGGFILMVFVAGIFALIVLLPPHANTSNAFPLPDENDKLPFSWFEHMLQTTNDVSHDNWFIRFFMGSFNYHVVHHLFPHINHVYYPEISKKLEMYAKEYELPYRKLTLMAALKNHYMLLKQNRLQESIWEESM